MKPLGRKPVKFPSKKDHRIRPKKKWKNWWEDLVVENKKGWRKRTKQLLKNTLIDT